MKHITVLTFRGMLFKVNETFFYVNRMKQDGQLYLKNYFSKHNHACFFSLNQNDCYDKCKTVPIIIYSY